MEEDTAVAVRIGPQERPEVGGPLHLGMSKREGVGRALGSSSCCVMSTVAATCRSSNSSRLPDKRREADDSPISATGSRAESPRSLSCIYPVGSTRQPAESGQKRGRKSLDRYTTASATESSLEAVHDGSNLVGLVDQT